MAETLTTHYELKKYDDGDNPGATNLNSNWTSIDEQVHRRELEVLTLDADVQVDLNAIAATVAGLVAANQTLVLVEKKVISIDAQDYTFSGLNGNVDLCYVLHLRLPATGSSTGWAIYPNADTTGADVDVTSDGTTVATATTGAMNVAQGGATDDVFADVLISAPTGMNRLMTSRVIRSGIHCEVWGAQWSNTVTNITSLKVHASVAAGLKSGAILTLYKMPNG